MGLYKQRRSVDFYTQSEDTNCGSPYKTCHCCEALANRGQAVLQLPRLAAAAAAAAAAGQIVWLTTLSFCHMSLKKPVLPLCPSLSPHPPLNPA